MEVQFVVVNVLEVLWREELAAHHLLLHDMSHLVRG